MKDPALRAARILSATLRALRYAPLLIAAIAVGPSPAPSAEPNPLMEGRGGDLNFPISCGAQLQPRFDAALAALHSFWYPQALEEFTALTQADPDCAIAHWGVAMSLWNQVWAPPRPDNLKAGHAAIDRARSAKQTSPRESAYIEALAAFYTDSDKLDHHTRALAYSDKMAAVAQTYPDDREARAFYALALLASVDPLDKTYKNQLKAGAILEHLFTEIPAHPGVAHYIIHAYDYPGLADRAVEAALKYQVCVTVVPHAIHMPSHTFVLLGRWQDTIKANIAGEEAEKLRGDPENRLHDLDYLVLAYLQLAQDRKAKEVVDLARQLEDDMVARKHDTGLRSRHYNLAALEARWVLERHDWAAAASLPLRPNRYAYAEAIPHFARAVGLARSGQPDAAQQEIDQLAKLEKALADAKMAYWAGQVEIERTIAAAWTAHARHNDDEALALMQAASRQEDGLDTHDTLNPGPIGMTADEGLGMLLLELKRPAQALTAFETSLRGAKNRLQSFAGAAAAAASLNDTATARKYYAKVAELTAAGDGDRPEVVTARAYLQNAQR